VDDQLDPGRIRFVEADGIATRVYEGGAGEPLILVHGGGFGSLYSLDCWSLNLEALERPFRVVAFDKLGQGHTGNPESDGSYTFQRLLAHGTALLDELDLGAAHVVGHSMGALLAARLVLDRPALARSLTIVDSNTVAPDDPHHPWTKFYVDLAARIPPGPPTLETVAIEPELQSWSREHITDGFLERLLEIARTPAFGEAEARARELRETIWMPSILPERARLLADIDRTGVPVPTLVVWGADDPSAPLPLALALYERIAAHTPESELLVLGRAGHYCFRERPAAFVLALTAFCLDR